MNARTTGVLTMSLLVGMTLAHAVATTPRPTRQQTIDPATGLAITMTTGAPGTASFEIADGRLTVRKDVLLGRSITTITSGSDRVSLMIDRAGLVVTTEAGTVTASLTRPETLEPVAEMLAQSAPVSDAAALLSRLRLDPATTTGQALTLTRALVQSVLGDRRGTRAVVLGLGPTSRRAGLVTARLGPSPSDCWDTYGTAATQTANDYADCYNSTTWYNVVGRLGCATLYDIEAECDWVEYLNCAGSSTG